MRLCLIVVLIAAGARASSLTNEVIVNSTQTTDSNPRTGSVGDAVAGSIDLSDLFALDLGAMVTSQNNSPSPVPGESPSPVVAFLNLGAAWMPGENVLVVLGGEWSPTATGFADAPIQLSTQTATAHIRSISSELGANLDVAWDSLGESNLEWSVSGGAHF